MRFSKLSDLRKKLSEFWPAYERDRAAVVSIAIFLAILAIAIFANYVAPYDPYQMVGLPHQRPSLKYPLGTNDIGQDIFGEVIYGVRASLHRPSSGTLIGTLVGLVSGYYVGKVDEALMRITDIT